MARGNQPLEKDLRSILRDERRFPLGTITFTEYAMGGDSGAPDSWFIADDHWQPLELKRGPSVVKKLRPTQIRWHKDSLIRNVRTYGATIHNGWVAVFELGIKKSGLTEKFWCDFPQDEFSYTDLIRVI